MQVPRLSIQNLLVTAAVVIIVHAITAPFRHSIDEHFERDEQ